MAIREMTAGQRKAALEQNNQWCEDVCSWLEVQKVEYATAGTTGRLTIEIYVDEGVWTKVRKLPEILDTKGPDPDRLRR